MAPLAPGGFAYAAPPVVAGAVVLLISPALAFALFALGAAIGAFYRDPARTPPAEGLVAPADGKVQVLRETSNGRVRVGVFMNVWDVHVNRAPVAGLVTDTEHVAGAHRPAFTKESDRNERHHIHVETPHGETQITLIAGAFARRIHPHVDSGADVDRGGRIGHISFGSRADVVLPPTVDREDLVVDRGDRVTAGETVLVQGDDLG